MSIPFGSQMSSRATMDRPDPTAGTDENAAPGLEVRLLGGFTVLRGGVPVAGPWRTEKARALVKLLALAPDHALQRDQVLEWLWPEQDPAAAANNLYFVLHVARRVLDCKAAGTTTILTLRDGVLRLAPPGGVATDVALFEQAARAAGDDLVGVERALAHYSGDLLPEDRYADWAAGRRRVAARALPGAPGSAGRLARPARRVGGGDRGAGAHHRCGRDPRGGARRVDARLRCYRSAGEGATPVRRLADDHAARVGRRSRSGHQALHAAIRAGDYPVPPANAASTARHSLPLPPRLLGRAEALAASTALLA